jgi:hypothetical protein
MADRFQGRVKSRGLWRGERGAARGTGLGRLIGKWYQPSTVSTIQGEVRYTYQRTVAPEPLLAEHE